MRDFDRTLQEKIQKRPLIAVFLYFNFVCTKDRFEDMVSLT